MGSSQVSRGDADFALISSLLDQIAPLLWGGSWGRYGGDTDLISVSSQLAWKGRLLMSSAH